MPNVIDVLEQRGFIDAMTSPDLRARLEKPAKVYVGFDPTAPSLHIGNLVGIIALSWMQKFGHTPVVVLGGATGLIGDPSGKSKERPLLLPETIEENRKGIASNFEKVLDFSSSTAAPIFFNNYDWFSSFSFLDFLRDVGKHLRMGPMLAKESVRSRLNSQEGLSYTEFSYQALQGYDYYHLYKNHGVCLQMGGSDQWGNITAGTDLIRKLDGGEVFGLTFPLLVRSDGKKFGKSEEGAIWLSSDLVSPYEFYQYLYRTADADVIQLLRLLTFIDMEEIREYKHLLQRTDTTPNVAQTRLAEEVTRIVHGEEGLQLAKRVTKSAAPGAQTDLETLSEIREGLASYARKKGEVVGKKYLDLLVDLDLIESKSAALRMLKNGGTYLNNIRVDDPAHAVTEADLIDGRFLLIALGKKKKVVVEISSSS